MIKQEDIRIGNYFLGFDNKPFKWELEHFTMAGSSSIDFDEIIKEPIPLTEEWLLKLGFIPDSIMPNHFNIQGMVIWKCNDLLMCDKNGTVLKSVHHLQNFYYAINGEELKATL